MTNENVLNLTFQLLMNTLLYNYTECVDRNLMINIYYKSVCFPER